MLGSWGLAACGGGDDDAGAGTAARRAPITIARASPRGQEHGRRRDRAGRLHRHASIYALGDPLTAATPAYKNDGTDTDFDNRAGDHHDGMEYFGLNAAGTARDANGSERGLLAMNHEATSNRDVRSYYLHANGGTRATRARRPRPTRRSRSHGVSVVEVRKTGGAWAYVQGSAYNRRITPLTPVQIVRPGARQCADEDAVLGRRHRPRAARSTTAAPATRPGAPT